jgi:hypothetical protein
VRLYQVSTLSTAVNSWQDHRQLYDEPTFLPVNYQSISTSPATYTVLATDLAATVELDGTTTVQVTLPKTLPVGFHCRVLQAGAGQIEFLAESGGQLRNRQSHTKTAGQYAVTNLYVSKNTNMTSAEWVLSGDTAA